MVRLNIFIFPRHAGRQSLQHWIICLCITADLLWILTNTAWVPFLCCINVRQGLRSRRGTSIIQVSYLCSGLLQQNLSITDQREAVTKLCERKIHKHCECHVHTRPPQLMNMSQPVGLGILLSVQLMSPWTSTVQIPARTDSLKSLKTLPLSRWGLTVDQKSALDVLRCTPDTSNSSCLNGARWGPFSKEQLHPLFLQGFVSESQLLCFHEWPQQSLLMQLQTKETFTSKYTKTAHNIYTNSMATFQLPKSQTQTSMETERLCQPQGTLYQDFQIFMKGLQNLLQ